MANSNMEVLLSVNADKFNADLKKAGKATSDLGSELKNFAASFVGITAAFAIVQKAFTDIIKTTIEFDKSLKNLQAITGVSSKDLEYFAESAIDVSIATGISARDVVEAYKLMGSARPELLQNSQALKEMTDSAIVLAQSSGLDLPDAVKRLALSMGQLHIPTKDAAKVVDVLAAASLAGSAEIPELTDALQNFGSVAKLANVNIKESAALIETLAANGIKGAEAGTALRNILLKLSAPDALPKEARAILKDFKVDLEKISDVSLPVGVRLGELNKIMTSNASAAEKSAALTKIFGVENINAAAALLNSLPAYEQFRKDVDKTGISLSQAATNTDTLSHKLEVMGTKWDAAWLSIKGGEGAVGGLITGFVDLVEYAASAADDIMLVFRALYESLSDSLAALGIGDSATSKRELKQLGEVYTDAQKKFSSSFTKMNSELRAKKIQALQQDLIDAKTKYLEALKNNDEFAKAFNKQTIANAEAQLKIAAKIRADEKQQTIKDAEEIEKIKLSGNILKTKEDRKEENKVKSELEKELSKSIEDYQKYIDNTAALDAKYVENHKKSIDEILQEDERRWKFSNDIAEKELQNALKIANEDEQKTIEALRRKNEEIKAITLDLTNAIKDMMANMVISVAESLGSMMAGGGGMEDLMKNMAETLTNFMSQIGKMMVTFGIAQLAFLVALKTPTPAAAIALIAGGAVLVGLAAALKSSMAKGPKPMAEGGLVYGPTMILSGEYSGAKSNPEVVAPLSKLQGMLNQGGGGGEYRLRIEGRDLVALIDKQMSFQKRIG